jgi:hypothetical protein
MKKLIFIMMCILVSGIMFADITTMLNFSEPQITRSDEGLNLNLENSVYITKPGNPIIPAFPVRKLLDPGEKAVSVEVNIISKKVISLEKELNWFQNPVPISQKSSVKKTAKNYEVYSSDVLYPQEIAQDLLTTYYRGYAIANANIYPYQYNPLSKELTIISEAEITIVTKQAEESQQALRFIRNDSETIKQIQKMVDNDYVTSFYPTNSRDRNNDNHLVVIADQQYFENLEPLIDLKNKQGFNPLLKDVNEIYSTVNGVDSQDKIRNFIIDCYENNGTDFVLLAGDTETIPHRGFRIEAGETIDNDIPSDLYYASLDRIGYGNGPDWDTNNNGNFGDLNEADFTPEIGVARISADTATEFDNAVNKQVMYQTEPVVNEIISTLLVGEELNDNPQTNGGDYLDQLKNGGGSYDGYPTVGFPADFDIEELYERDTYWSQTTLKNQMNSGTHLLSHLGHSFTDFNMKFYTPDVTDVALTSNGTNHSFHIIYSQGCYPAAFDNRGTEAGDYGEDCIMEAFTTNQNGVAAYVGNSRYGWYHPGGTNSSSQFMNRQFFDALFGEEITQISLANNDSKVDGVSRVSDPWFRWAYYELNVFGDPTLDIFTAQPTALNPIYTAQMPISETSLAISNIELGARVCLSKNGNVIASGIAAISDAITLNFDEALTELGDYDLYITAHNHLIYSGVVEVINSDSAYLVVENIEYTSEDGDDILEFGETVTANISIRNAGQQDSDSVTFVIMDTNDNVLITTDSYTATSGIGAGETFVCENAIAFTVDTNVEDQTNVSLASVIVAGSSSWNTALNFTLAAPTPMVTEIMVADGGNNVLDPGETANINITLSNTGHADLSQLTAALTSSSDDITVNTASLAIDELNSGNNAVATFEVTVASSVAEGDIAEFDLNLTDTDGYEKSLSMSLTIGLTKEDFESGDFSSFDWEHSGNSDWTIVGDAYEGSYAAKSGNISDNQNSGLAISGYVLSAGQISFAVKVSCENDSANDYDKLIFFIDGVEQDRWDGEIAWTVVDYNVSAGEHIFTWKYVKDGGVSDGSDCAWIDNITFPSINFASGAMISVSANSITFGDVNHNDVVTETFTITNTGSGDLTGTFELPPYITIAPTLISIPAGLNQ